MLKCRTQIVQVSIDFRIPANLVRTEEMGLERLDLSGEKREMPVGDLFDLFRVNQYCRIVSSMR